MEILKIWKYISEIDESLDIEFDFQSTFPERHDSESRDSLFELFFSFSIKDRFRKGDSKWQR